MASAKSKTKYILGEDTDIQGMAWHKGDTIYCIALTGDKEDRCDLFLTPHPEYARRGSRAPVHRALAEHLVIEGETLIIANPDADEQLLTLQFQESKTRSPVQKRWDATRSCPVRAPPSRVGSGAGG